MGAGCATVKETPANIAIAVMINFALALTAVLATSVPPSLDNDFDTALGAVGLTRDSARFDTGVMRFFSESEFRTPIFQSMHENPWRIPFYSDMWLRQYSASVGDPGEVVATAGRMLGLGTRRNLLGNPIQSAVDAGIKQGSLRSVLETYRKRGLMTGAVPDLSNVPGNVQEAASVVLQVALQTIPYRRAALANAPKYADLFRRAQADRVESADPEENQSDLAFYRQLDLRYMFAAGGDVVAAAKHAQLVAQGTEASSKYRVSIQTDWGKVVLSGGTDDTYADEPTLLVIDTGGRDTYVNGASNRSPNNWLSIVVDTNADDRYVSATDLVNTKIADYAGRKGKGAFGPSSALFGITALIDSSGNDLYRSHRPGIGSAFGGVAYLEDSVGDDIYDAYTDAIGHAAFGIGILDDWKGADRYTGFTNVEGSAGVSGLGLLVDRLGDDQYVANNEVLDFPSPQTKLANVSMAQGAATGRRADYIDGHSLSGGVGILMDEDGNDRYTCGVFGQGVGYWEGIGILHDEGGADKYTGQWYVQGASAHFGIGYLHDAGGSDEFTAGMNMAQGAGHDFGIGFLLKEGGADKYKAPNLSLGAGNANGIGVFVDTSGDDVYDASGTTLGRAAEAPKGSLRERALALGVFMDLSGQDVYPSSVPWAQNARRTANWTDRRPAATESQTGVFWDR